MSHPSRSDEQQAAEPLVRDLLAAQTGLRYEPEKINVDGVAVDIDGVGRDTAGEVVELVEIYARQDKLKSGQQKKPTDDAARLYLAGGAFPSQPILRLAVCSRTVMEQIERSWRGKALAAMRVELTLVDLPDDIDESIRAAQRRQTR